MDLSLAMLVQCDISWQTPSSHEEKPLVNQVEFATSVTKNA